MQEPGTYFARVKGGTLTTSKDGKPNFAVQFDVMDFATNGEWRPLPLPVERTVYLSFSDAAIAYTEAKLLALGFDGNFETPGFSRAATEEGVSLICRHETYEGKAREKWDLLEWGGGKEVEPAPADVRRQVAAMWKDRQRKTAKPAGRPTSPPPQPTRAPAQPPTGPVDPLRSKAGTQREAWAEVLAAYNGDGKRADEYWQSAYAKVAGSRPATALTAAEWSRIADEASIPI